MRRVSDIEDLEALREEIRSGRDPDARTIAVCCGTGCLACGARAVVDAFQAELESRGLTSAVRLLSTGCHGFCERGPLVVVRPSGVLYQRVKPKDVAEIVEVSVESDGIVERLLYVDPVTGEKITREEDVPFYKHQRRLVLESNGIIDPTSIEDYIAVGGYAALAKALGSMTPEDVVASVKASGLRGRGGGGFPTGVKWELCRNSPGDVKYLICNADEGDPGAYMDRSILEGNPHSVLEGMLIGAYALGAREGYIYVRLEYPLAVSHFGKALADAEAAGLLGEDILGTGFSFSVAVSRGGGAFVCGEETALMASIEGRSGRPRPRPPYPAQCGLWGRPTNINNVETWANVPRIILEGGEWYARIGTKKSKGTKIFSLVGKVANTGLIEVPMGIPLREIVFDIGGGIPGGKRFKAVQSGGPSGGCIPESLIDLPVDFEALAEAGSIMGSGGLIVMDEDTCMVDVARYFVSFLEEESCGKCTPCREGLKRMGQILTDIVEARGKPGDIERLEELAYAIQEASLCGLGKTAANPVLTTIRYFRDEYESHVLKKRCPAKVCKAMIVYRVIAETCTGCQRCVKACPVEAITGPRSQPHNVDEAKCIKCGACYEVCRFDAIAGDAIYIE
jgi:NADH:ubiquinone oxidoreductase subunit F (NADH-binding)/(2Fe-2S) ferredoxin/NAD-dependent dihydropyrimidine dehydrogenase PreA subunit